MLAYDKFLKFVGTCPIIKSAMLTRVKDTFHARLPSWALIIGLSTFGSICEAKQLYVPEPALERALCQALSVDRENLTESLVAEKLRFLEVNDSEIRNLQGLEGAVNLETLVLKDNLIQDLRPLAELANLRKLDLAGNKISSLRSLIPLSRSKMERRASELQASLNNYKTPKDQIPGMVLELTELVQRLKQGAWSLSVLDLSRNRLLGMTGIEHLTLLQHLNVSENALIDLEGISQLKRLVTLYAQANQLGRVEGYVDENRNRQYDPGETINDESGNGKRDVDPLVELRSLPSLVNLHLYGNLIQTTKSMADLPNLRVLLLGGNKIQQLEGIAQLSNLIRLSLSDNRLNDLTGIENLSSLEHLYLIENRICDLRPLAKLRTVRELRLQRNQFFEVDPLAQIEDLEILLLSNNLVFDPTPLLELKKLRRLSLSGNCMILEQERTEDFLTQMQLQGIKANVGEQKERSLSVENLVSSLIGHPFSNQRLGDYLEANGYFRLMDFVEDGGIAGEDKSLSYSTWETYLKTGKSLEEVPFPSK